MVPVYVSSKKESEGGKSGLCGKGNEYFLNVDLQIYNGEKTYVK
jgi:hypothetical protein